MKKILFLLLLILSSVISFSQRYTGYGRGYDFGDTEKIMNYQPSYWFALLLAGMMLIGGLTFLYSKIDEFLGLKTGKYIKVVSGGKICITSDFTKKQYEIVKIWKIEDFGHQHGQLKTVVKYREIKEMTYT